MFLMAKFGLACGVWVTLAGWEVCFLIGGRVCVIQSLEGSRVCVCVCVCVERERRKRIIELRVGSALEWLQATVKVDRLMDRHYQFE